MKTSVNKIHAPLNLSFGILLLGIVTCCSHVQTTPERSKDSSSVQSAENEAASSRFVGTWIGGGETSSLTIKGDGSCVFHDGMDEFRSEGTWRQNGNSLIVHLNHELSWGDNRKSKSNTFYHVRKKWSEGNEQEFLTLKPDHFESYVFYKSKG